MPPTVVTQTRAPLPDWLELVSKVDAKIRSLSNKRGWYNRQVNHTKINFLKEIKDLLQNPSTDILNSLDTLVTATPDAFYRRLPGTSETEKIFKEVYSTYQALAKKRDELVEKTKPFFPNINLDDITVEGELSVRDHIIQINTYYQDKDNIGKKFSRKEGLCYSVLRVEGDDGNIHTLTFYKNFRPDNNLYSFKNNKKKGGVLAKGHSPLRIVLVESEINGVKKTWWGACKVMTSDSVDDIEREAQTMRDVGLPHTQNTFAFYRKRKNRTEPFKRGIVFPLLNGLDFLYLIYPKNSSSLSINTIDTILSIFSNIIQEMIITYKAGYLHGDMKPENFMCTTDLKGHLCDFGYSRKLDDINKSYQFYGTPRHLPDEVLENYGTEPLSYSTDLYSLGASIKIGMKWLYSFYKRDFLIRSSITYPDNNIVNGKLVRGTRQFPKDFMQEFERADFYKDFGETLNPTAYTLFGPKPELKPLFDYANKLMDYKTNKTMIHTAKIAEIVLSEFDQVMKSINATQSAPAPSAPAVPPKP